MLKLASTLTHMLQKSTNQIFPVSEVYVFNAKSIYSSESSNNNSIAQVKEKSTYLLYLIEIRIIDI